MKLRRGKQVQFVDGNAINEELRNQVEFYKNKLGSVTANVPQKEIIEVEKIVERVIYKDDPALLEKYNQAMKELGAVRMEKAKGSENNVVYLNGPEKIVEKIVNKRSWKEFVVAVILSAFLASGGTFFLVKKEVKEEKPVQVEVKKKK